MTIATVTIAGVFVVLAVLLLALPSPIARLLNSGFHRMGSPLRAGVASVRLIAVAWLAFATILLLLTRW